MKYIWEAVDIIGGRQVENCSRTERYIIGYEIGYQKDGRLILVSLTDGMLFTKDHTEESLAEYLNCKGDTRRAFKPVDIREDNQND
jgi:hypothetical protein